MTRLLKRALVVTLARADGLIDEVLYRPAIVKAFLWMPRWWQCNLAKASIRLDDRWSTGYWTEDSMYPGGPCAACGRRASIFVQGELEADEEPIGDYVEAHPVYTCGWCQCFGPLSTEADVQRELAAARADSISWRWRWRVRP